MSKQAEKQALDSFTMLSFFERQYSQSSAALSAMEPCARDFWRVCQAIFEKVMQSGIAAILASRTLTHLGVKLCDSDRATSLEITS